VSIGSGLGSSVGFVPEGTYGTYAAPTRFVEGIAALRKTQNFYQGGGMAAGRFVRPGARRYVTQRGGGGTFTCPVVSKSMGHLINGLMGGTVTPVQQGATTAYLQTHALADPVGKSYTFQSGVPDAGGTVRPYTWLGSQVISVELSCEIGGPLMATFEVIAKDVTEAQTLAAPSYPVSNEFHHALSAVKLGTVGAEAAVDGVKSLTLKIERSRHEGGPYMGSGGLRSIGVINDYAKITGTFTTDFIDKTVFADRFAANTSTSLVWEFIGPNIASTFFETFRVRVPMVFLNGETPAVSGPDVVEASFPFEGQYDGSNAAATVELISTDTTL
jgi:hypothetical protein